MSNLLSVSKIFTYIGYIGIAILVLLFMVLIHELGHYVAGKILKFKINEFSVGFGPKILQKKKKNGELISLRAFPLGGYCAFEGEGEDENPSPDAFNKQKPWKRLIVLFCGAFFNFLSAIIFSFILLVSSGYDYVQIKSVAPQSINYNVMYAGDVITGVNGNKIDFVDDEFMSVLITEDLMVRYAKADDIVDNNDYSYTKDGKTFYLKKGNIKFDVKRDDKSLVVDAYINVVYDADGNYAGWSLLNTENDNGEFALKTYKYSFGEALGQSIPFTCKWAWKVLKIFGQLITGQLSLTSLGGPVTTINMIASYTQQSANYLLILLPLIAVNLAVFNLLPIPALDGFQMIFVTIEWIRKKPVKQNVVNLINNIGLIALLGFVIVIDVLQFVL
ncbi:MAG: site-2 protease family protein [Clostridia bacterium]|nr:site-2 protease family protein [Clostridia bacterium]